MSHCSYTCPTSKIIFSNQNDSIINLSMDEYKYLEDNLTGTSCPFNKTTAIIYPLESMTSSVMDIKLVSTKKKKREWVPNQIRMCWLSLYYS